MSTGDNKTIIRRFYAEVVSKGDLSRLEEFISANYIDHNAEGPERGPGVVRIHLQALRRTFPDFHLQIDEIIREGDMVATRVSGHGTHKGEWMGIRPTSAVVRLKGINISQTTGSSNTGAKRIQSECCARWGSIHLPVARVREPLRRWRLVRTGLAPTVARTAR